MATGALWVASVLLPLALLPDPGWDLTDSLQLDDGRILLVEPTDTLVREASLYLDYRTSRIVSMLGRRRDTIVWISDPPSKMVAAARRSGRNYLYEAREVSIVSATGSYLCGLLEVVTSSRAGGDTTRFEALRTWLYDGTTLELEDVVQMDSLFYHRLGESLGCPDPSRVSDWLWSKGYSLDPQSFMMLPGEDGDPMLMLGICRGEEPGDMLVVRMGFSSLNTASQAMLD
ncbi:hypothetical protein GF402_07100 [Candidatus Fermentibacteria bacterium]|nr:hypothetical protein [Candidatus Fermentibacteria bacterium]